MHPDHTPYFKFTGLSRLDKETNTLLGLVEGIAIDGVISRDEADFLRFWISQNSDIKDRHPFSELIPALQSVIVDGIMDGDSREDILWLCRRLRSTEFYESTTADLQRLHAIVAGISADQLITREELRGLSEWLSSHQHLRTCWPFDEIDSLITTVLSDGKIDDDEHNVLQSFFGEFISLLDNKTISNPVVLKDGLITGLCAVCPEIAIAGSRFCLTGTSLRYSRRTFAAVVERLGGKVVQSVSPRVDYLVIGADGNPCWSYSCYGRKVEQAVKLRKAGVKIMIVHENDLHDAIADLT